MTMAAERFFAKIADDVEQIAARMEEGLGVVFGAAGESSATTTSSSGGKPTSPTPAVFDDGEEADPDMEELLRGNPLQDMTESVLQGIMQGQVRENSAFFCWALIASLTLTYLPLVVCIVSFSCLLLLVTVVAVTTRARDHRR
jgi:hypothetical protein